MQREKNRQLHASFLKFNNGNPLAFGYNNLVPDIGNPWYTGGAGDGSDGDEAMRLLQSSYISGKWIDYLMVQYDLPGIEFPGLSGRKLLTDNLDFMLRFWKREGYFA